jgi:hypothetical protein
MSFLKSLLQVLISVFAPVILVVLGAGIISLGLQFEIQFALWMGLIMMAAGFFWGLVLFFYYGGAD